MKGWKGRFGKGKSRRIFSPPVPDAYSSHTRARRSPPICNHTLRSRPRSCHLWAPRHDRRSCSPAQPRLLQTLNRRSSHLQAHVVPPLHYTTTTRTTTAPPPSMMAVIPGARISSSLPTPPWLPNSRHRRKNANLWVANSELKFTVWALKVGLVARSLSLSLCAPESRIYSIWRFQIG